MRLAVDDKQRVRLPHLPLPLVPSPRRMWVWPRDSIGASRSGSETAAAVICRIDEARDYCAQGLKESPERQWNARGQSLLLLLCRLVCFRRDFYFAMRVLFAALALAGMAAAQRVCSTSG